MVFLVILVVLLVYCSMVMLLVCGVVFWNDLLVFLVSVLVSLVVCGRLQVGIIFLMCLIMKLMMKCFSGGRMLLILVMIICLMLVFGSMFLIRWVMLVRQIIVLVLELLNWCFSLCVVYSGLVLIMMRLVCMVLKIMIGYCRMLGNWMVMWLLGLRLVCCCRQVVKLLDSLYSLLQVRVLFRLVNVGLVVKCWQDFFSIDRMFGYWLGLILVVIFVGYLFFQKFLIMEVYF